VQVLPKWKVEDAFAGRPKRKIDVAEILKKDGERERERV